MNKSVVFSATSQIQEQAETSDQVEGEAEGEEKLHRHKKRWKTRDSIALENKKIYF